MNQSKNQLILGLSISAVVLLAVLIGLYARPAHAAVTASGGDYSAASAAISISRDVVYIVDNPTKRMIVYRYDRGKKSIQVVDARDLAKDLK